MGKCRVTSVNSPEITLQNIFIALEDESFCKDKAAKIVGGVKKLEDMIAKGEIRAEKPTMAKNGKWFCNAADVLKNCRNMRE